MNNGISIQGEIFSEFNFRFYIIVVFICFFVVAIIVEHNTVTKTFLVNFFNS